MPLKVLILSIAYLVAGIVTIVKYSNTGLYTNIGELSYGELLRAALPFLLFYIAFGLFAQRRSGRQTALYFVFLQYTVGAYLLIKVGMSTGDTPIEFADWTPLFLQHLASTSPWQMVGMVFFFTVAQHWVLIHEDTIRIYGDTT